MVSNASFIGDFVKNPFFFESFNLSSINLQINNISLPIRPLSVNFKGSETMLPYYLLNKCASKMNNNEGLVFDHSRYIDGYSLFAFDIAPLECIDSSLNLEKSGSVKLELKFSSALTEAVTLISLSLYQQVLEIDKTRQTLIQ